MKLNGESIEKHLKQVKICLKMDIMLDFFVKDFQPGKLGGGIHSKSEKVFEVCFSVTKNLRKKCVHLDIKILQQKCVNH